MAGKFHQTMNETLHQCDQVIVRARSSTRDSPNAGYNFHLAASPLPAALVLSESILLIPGPSDAPDSFKFPILLPTIQRIRTPTMAPITFTARGVDLDTRLWILGAEYHVHSTVLKMKSEFFFRFMDSPDKKPNVGGPFKYEWISHADIAGVQEDGLKWHLVARGKDEAIDKYLLYARERPAETESFHALLCAMYGLPYKVRNEDAIERIVKLADYYLALPVVSNTIAAALFNTGIELNLKTTRLPEYALKLRHVGLLQDFVVHYAGYLHGDSSNLSLTSHTRYSELSPDLKAMITKAIASIDQNLGVAHRVCSAYDWPQGRPAPSHFGYYKTETLVEYYRRVQSELNKSSSGINNVAPLCLVDQLLSRNLDIDTPELFVDHSDVFLCGKFYEQDLPWNTTATDW